MLLIGKDLLDLEGGKGLDKKILDTEYSIK